MVSLSSSHFAMEVRRKWYSRDVIVDLLSLSHLAVESEARMVLSLLSIVESELPSRGVRREWYSGLSHLVCERREWYSVDTMTMRYFAVE
ncbi:hypothetical protein L195_g019838 [Trifolium pratense]|uniref:Uncharacterized protein n=1 Tax=Trifolium pratense TaxID=57577 RepID=A0A2K3N0R1_TRIPR|nr:hypothetical protein L195_g019838 [Trifolium pratense]